MNAPTPAVAPDLGTGGYLVDILVHGYPGKSVCHGGLGWSTIALLRGHGRIALVDVGCFGQRDPILKGLARVGLTPADVTDVILSHSHWDHSVNWVMFPKARIVIGEEELAWSLAEPWGTTPVPELYVRELDRSPKTVRVKAGDEVLPGITCHHAPGHTPGHLVFVLEGEKRDLILTGDAAKNRAEILSLEADMTYDPAVSRASMEAIWTMWRKRPGTILVPGHDMPMVLDADEPRYLRGQEAAISSWFDRTLDKTTLFQLV
ncbi:MBL fold metallo-hydrolase [Enterovirga rhinocerotis]|uniref:Glyoxylase-like metal-dependent hydrolase (Beta-lactamase superfamily II) n=1 Tax=Enterovirga rhinocerotis TaxID=1339210 RepID=A0A4R7BW77_9HYPH|nr:MBL fold metallo-hydrolase [Enterovirga rhinocerotis]TDR90120.1 glyoxylase-like metal-dependent hydrolase (beta-lactamase superfamily II) [Enterovirga rhinocerotis]